MLDFSRLRTPPGDGDVLIEPPSDRLAALAESSHALLRSYRFDVLDFDIQSLRTDLRAALCAGCDHPTVITGHQPEFIHAGVWAKHIVASDLARTLGGKALNIVVDSDAPTRSVLEVPAVVGERVEVRAVHYAQPPHGVTHEGISRLGPGDLEALTGVVADALGERYQRSYMPMYFAAMAAAGQAGDWVDQMQQARRAVERTFGVEMIEHRASRVWYGPMLTDLMLNAGRFRECYNSALAEYRRVNRVRGPKRPIPDLAGDGARCELPVWVYRLGEPRRRLFVERATDRVNLYADADHLAQVPLDDLARWDRAGAALENMGGYLFRPRALSLTLWARICVGDLFIHGIGGAKYDRITDGLIRRYFNVEPPAMACVSATLLMALPDSGGDDALLRSARTRVRDIEYNPQRHVRRTAQSDALAVHRQRAVTRSIEMRSRARRDRRGRRAVFDEIRSLNARLLTLEPALLDEAEAEVGAVAQRAQAGRAAGRRDYFFAMHERPRLQRLRETLALVVRNRV